MLWHLIAAASAGLGAAGIALLARHVSRRYLPRWIIPVAAGLGMLGYQVYYEYNWASYRLAQMPEQAQLLDTQAEPAFWRPWSRLWPMTTHFTVADTGNLAHLEIQGDPVVRFVAYHFERLAIERMHYRTYLLNCITGERVPLTQEGTALIAELVALPEQHSWRQTLCITHAQSRT